MGGEGATDDPGGIVCIHCFIKRAEVEGIAPTAWVLDQERLEPEVASGDAKARLQEIVDRNPEDFAEPYPDPASGEQMEVIDNMRTVVSWLLGSRILGHEVRAVRSAEVVKRGIDALDAAQKAIAERDAQYEIVLNSYADENQRFSDRIERMEKAIRLLLDCPDIADNDDKDEETHAAERFARAALHSEQEQSDADN